MAEGRFIWCTSSQMGHVMYTRYSESSASLNVLYKEIELRGLIPVSREWPALDLDLGVWPFTAGSETSANLSGWMVGGGFWSVGCSMTGGERL